MSTSKSQSRSKSTRRKPTSLVAKLSLSLASLAAVFVVAELGMRVIGFKPRSATVLTSYFQPDSNVGWIGRPNVQLRFTSSEFDVLVTHDEDGFRHSGIDSSIQSDADFDGKVVWCVGDSTTWAWGVENEQTWVYLLNELTDDQQIYRNLGIPGCSTLQEYYLLKGLFERDTQPDEVLLLYCGNDVGDNLDTTRSRPYFDIVDGQAEIKNYPAETPSNWNRRAWLKSNCLVYNYLSYSAMRAKAGLRRILGKEQERITPELSTGLNLEPAAELNEKEELGLRTAFSMIADLCSRNDVQLMLATATPTPDVKRICTELSIPVVDISEHFLRHESSEDPEPVVFQYDPHWNELGNKIVAEGFHQELQEIRTALTEQRTNGRDGGTIRR